MIFHVQTEDSGVLSPHLFTHLFHEGVIVSTRKLVYDAGASPEAIKALMQAQHKAVLKDLNKGVFDQKIDQYLAGTPGLEPRPAAAVAADAKPSATVAPDSESQDGDQEGHDEDAPNARRRIPRDTMVDAKPSEPPFDSGKVIEELPVSRHAASSIAPPSEAPSDRPSRPMIPAEAGPSRRSSDSDPVQIYAPAPPAVDPPPDPNSRASGLYSMRRASTQSPHAPSPPSSGPSTMRGVDPASRSVGGSTAQSAGHFGAGPNRPVTAPPGTHTGRSPVVPAVPAGPLPAVPNALPALSRTSTLPHRVGLTPPPARPSSAVQPAMPAVAAPSPAVMPPPAAVPPPAAAAPPPARVNPPAKPPTAGSNVVMTRPAVIVGGPAASGSQRNRVVQEQPARPFGQGLISEKSLDEVIHAYLSEDGEEP